MTGSEVPLAVSAARVASDARRRVVDIARQRSTPLHTASALSALELLSVAVLSGLDDDGAQLVLSKGHAALGYYAVLASLGLLPEAALEEYAVPGSPLTVHPERDRVTGVHFTTGSLGHGPALATGWIIGRRLRRERAQATVLIGDGEAQEGSVAEAAAFAADAQLRELRVVIDANAYGQTTCLSGTSSADGLASAFEGLGWAVYVIDGHDTPSIVAAFEDGPTTGRPSVVIGRTRKAEGAPGLARGLPSTHFAVWTDG
jgi:transketolase